MENGLKTIMSLFNGDKIFIIPKYQRAYAWTEKHLKEFYEDIHHINIEKKYFFGTILFQELEDEEGYESIEIVDGQQRLTTLLIFIRVLLNKINGHIEDKKYRILKRRFMGDENFSKLRVLDIDNIFFQDYILRNKDTSSFQSPSQNRMWDAKKYFDRILSDVGNERLMDYLKKIENTNLLTYSVSDASEATLIFETTNDRGKSLTNLEKTKSFLMYKTYLAAKKPNEYLRNIHDRFRTIYLTLEKIDNKLDEDSILQYHFIAFENWAIVNRKKEYQNYMTKIKTKMNKKLENGKNKELIKYIDNYSHGLMESFNCCESILSDKYSFLRDIFILGRVRNFWPLLLKVKKYDKSPNQEHFKKIVRLVEIFSFRVFGIGKSPSQTGETTIYSLARDFKGNFENLITRLKEILNQYDYDGTFVRMLNDTNFYGRISNNDKKYLFWKYENWLRTRFQPVSSELSEEEFLTKDKRKKLTIEHITSQNPKNGLSFEEESDEFKEKYLHSLGNLTIDPKSANSSKGNEEWEYKSFKYFEKSTFKTQLELSGFVNENKKKWSSETINQRAEKIINQFATKYWDYHNV